MSIKVEFSRQIGYRFYGGFQFILLDSENRILHYAITCKDYLQDLFYGWYTGKDRMGTMKYANIDLDSSTFKLALVAENLNKSRMNIRKLLNLFEDALNIPRSWIFKTENPDIIVVRFSKEWSSNPLLLSSMTTILRMSALYKGEGVLEYFRDLKYDDVPNYMRADVSRINLRRIAALLKGISPELSWEELGLKYDIHSTGMINYKDFPEVDID